jgi:hypothetical protein
MPHTYDVTTDRGKVRLLINDVSTNPALQIFQDAEIDAFLGLEDSNIRRAAAMGLLTIAGNEVMILKVIELMDLKTDGAATGRELRMQAELLRKQADDAEEREGGGFDVIEQVFDEFSWREHVWNEALRAS